MPVIIGAAIASTAFSQSITVFEDDFTRPDGAPGGPWTVTTSPDGDWGASIVDNRLRLTNTATGGTRANGWVSVSAPTSQPTFALPYASVLEDNPGLVTWSFNMQQIREDPGGFTSNAYGVAFVLGSTTQAFATDGDGYAVVLGNSNPSGGGDPTNDPIQLVHYSEGLQSLGANSGFSDPNKIVVAPVNSVLGDPTNSHLSIQVTYDPATHEWRLYGRNDGSAFVDPLSGSLTFVGSGTDSTHTGIGLDYSGMYWQGSTAADQHAFFDNITISVIPEPRTYALFGIAALLLLAGFRHARRKTAVNSAPAQECR